MTDLPTTTASDSRPVDVLSAVERTLSEIAPMACALDTDEAQLREVFTSLARKGYFVLRRPAALDGAPFTNDEKFHWKLMFARTSGTLAFLAAQMQSATSILSASKNTNLAAECISLQRPGSPTLGIGFGYLRRRSDIPLKAVPVPNGYLLNGVVPWGTGYGVFDKLVVGAELPDQTHLLAIVPFAKAEGLAISPPLQLAAMGVTQTCRFTIEKYFVPSEQVVDIRNPDWLDRHDESRLAEGAAFAMGCAAAAINSLQRTAVKMKEPASVAAGERFRNEYEDLLDLLLEAVDDELMSAEKKLALRGRAHAFSARVAFAAVTAASGASNLLSHDAQRIYREALSWSILAQTHATRESTLSALFPSE